MPGQVKRPERPQRHQPGEHCALQGWDALLRHDSNGFCLHVFSSKKKNFVTTAKKQSLLDRGVIRNSTPDNGQPRGQLASLTNTSSTTALTVSRPPSSLTRWSFHGGHQRGKYIAKNTKAATATTANSEAPASIGATPKTSKRPEEGVSCDNGAPASP